MTQPEALRLADLIRSRHGNDINDEAAAELRRLHEENKLLHERYHDDNVEYTRVLAQRDALLEALKPMIDLAEFWINHRQERRVSEEQYNVWIALGHESTAMLKARAAIKAVEEAG